MKNFLTAAATIFVASVVITASAWSQVSVPNTFSPGFAADPAGLNANFQAVVDGVNVNVDAISALSAGAPAPLVGYSGMPPFPAAAGDPENLVILLEKNPNESFSYVLRIAYIADDGTPTWDFPSVTSPAPGTVSGFWSLVRWELPSTSNTRVREVTVFAGVSGFPPSLPTFVTLVESQEEFCFAPRLANVPRTCAERAELTLESHVDVGSVDYRFTTRTNMLGASADRGAGQSVTVNGMTFNDVAYRFEVRAPFINRVRIIANGIGEIYRKNDGTARYRDTRSVIWYRVNGVTDGSLSGTPFDAGGDAVGVFFTP